MPNYLLIRNNIPYVNLRVGSFLFRKSLADLTLKQAKIVCNLIGNYSKTLDNMNQDELRVALTEIKHHFVGLIRGKQFPDQFSKKIQRARVSELGGFLLPFVETESKPNRSTVMKNASLKDKQAHLESILNRCNLTLSDATPYQQENLNKTYIESFKNTQTVFEALDNPGAMMNGKNLVESIIQLYPTNEERDAVTIDQAFEMFLDVKSELRKESVEEFKRYVNLFKAVNGADANLLTFNNKHWKEFLATCAKFPTKAKKPFRSMDYDEIYSQYVLTGKYRNFKDQCYSPKTLEEIVKFFQGIYQVLADKEIIQDKDKPIFKMKKSVKAMQEGKNQKKKGKFELDEVERLLNHYKTLPEEQYWFYTLIAYTGLRLTEAAKLKKADIDTDYDTQRKFLVIPDENAKSDAGIRQIPISLKLIKAGFLNWVESRPFDHIFHIPNDDGRSKSKDKSRLFYTQTTISTKYTKEIMPAANVSAFKGTSTKPRSLHCWRHTIITYLTAQSISMSIIQTVIGHEKERAGATTEFYLDYLAFKDTVNAIDALPW